MFRAANTFQSEKEIDRWQETPRKFMEADLTVLHYHRHFALTDKWFDLGVASFRRDSDPIDFCQARSLESFPNLT